MPGLRIVFVLVEVSVESCCHIKLRIDKEYQCVIRHTHILCTIIVPVYYKKYIKYVMKMFVCELSKDMSQI